MNRPFPRSHRRRSKRKSVNRYRMAIVATLLVALVGSVAFIGLAPSSSGTRQAFADRVNNWWAERKTRIATKMASSQQKLAKTTVALKSKSSAPEPLHFEFYNMLPNNGTPVVTKSSSIFDHDHLEREFAKTVEKISYVIQTGIYSNSALADKARDELAEEGLAAKVVKAYIDERPVYRIQVGPYQEKDQINDVQAKLASRGIHGVLRKAEERIA